MDRTDPRLTAFACDELEGAERDAVAAAIAADPALAAEVAAIRALTAQLPGALADVAGAERLTAPQRARIAAAARPRGNRIWFPVLTAAAAALVLGATWLLVQPDTAPAGGDARAVARQDALAPKKEAERTELKGREEGIAESEIAQPAEVRDETPSAAGRMATGDLHSATDKPTKIRQLEEARAVGTAPAPAASFDANAPAPSTVGVDQDAVATAQIAALPPTPAPVVLPAQPQRHKGLRDRGAEAAPETGGQGLAFSRGVGGATAAPSAPPAVTSAAPAARMAAERIDRAELMKRSAGALAHQDQWRAQPEAKALRARAAAPFTDVRTPGGDASTFAVDVDTASLGIVRRLLMQEHRLPAPEQVRPEEFINAFRYDYTPPPADGAHPFAVHAEVGPCPWNGAHRLARVALRGRDVPVAERPAANLVFLIDVSGSMADRAKLPLLQDAFSALIDRLDQRDRITVVTYAGNAGVVLPATRGDRRDEIRRAIDALRAEGGTNGAGGIRVAYDEARRNLIAGGVNRVILATDGDFNVGVSDTNELVRLVRESAAGGVHLTVLGVGSHDLKDDRLERLADQGDGQYHYLDGIDEARRVFGARLSGSIVTIAKDVKVQVFFNPARVAAWRLIGYANRQLAREQFNDDRVDAGEIGAGHTVTALYELVPAGTAVPGGVDPNPFLRQAVAEPAANVGSDALLRLRLRHQPPAGGASRLDEFDVVDPQRALAATTRDFRFAAAAAAAAERLAGSGAMRWSDITALARGAAEADAERQEFLRLIDRAAALQGEPAAAPADTDLRPAQE